MKVLHLSYDYGLKGTSGAPIAAARLHLALLRHGVDSHFICVRQLEEGPNVLRLPKSPVMGKLFYFYPRVFWVLSKLMTGKMLMTNIFPLPDFNRIVARLKPDIVHLHFISQDMVSFAQLERLDCKFVYTLHDMTSVNAIESHPCSDTRFTSGFDKYNSTASERWMFNRKNRFINRIKPLFVGPSNWICKMTEKSLIGRDLPIKMILNIGDPAFRFDPSMLHPHEKFTILFGAFGGRASPYKGWPDLEAAIKSLPAEVQQNTVINVFGESADDYMIGKTRIHFLGEIKNVDKMRKLHHEADVFALPSRQDNAPQVKFEALLDGLPVLAFNRTGCAEFIRNGVNGWVAKDGDIADYARGIERFYALFAEQKLNATRSEIAVDATSAFSEEKIVSEMLKAYSEL